MDIRNEYDLCIEEKNKNSLNITFLLFLFHIFEQMCYNYFINIQVCGKFHQK